MTQDPVPPEETDDGPLALDIDAMPGGAKAAIEAILMVTDEPVTPVALATALEVTLEQVLGHLATLEQEYADRGFALREVAGGWRIYSRPEYAAAVERFILEGATAKLTQASLETLAVVAYRQPISRGRIGAVRGVNVDGVVRTLLARGLIEEVGSEPESGALLYGTTGYFLERLGLRDLAELPALAPYLPEVDVLDELAEQGRA
ncbi:MAG: SMC-Scp complex subunit ScpB [Actinobacteria bacterium]|uniref:SMC-Scp complex subunit ScpB n=1 Tax=Nostocoides veronense TaxID=330836 RepID=A0ABP4XJD9_9MICO|nr:SMC-Scp complex subunit ScpB [Actinomycetota bacterium]